MWIRPIDARVNFMAKAEDGSREDLTGISERELVERWIQSKDHAASTELYQRYTRRLLQRAGAERSRSDPLSTVYHDAFGTFLRRAPTMTFHFDHDDWLWRLLSTIAARKRIVKFRQGSKALSGGDPVADLQAVSEGEPSSEEVAIYNDLREQLLSRLSGQESLYLIMREEGYTRKEIAVELKCDARQVRRIGRSVELKASRLFQLPAEQETPGD
jgi:DNA-directed RNA polymerase specialized sigma24 family protein